MLQLFKFWLNRYSHVNWTLADQAIVSGLNFLTGILLARFLGLEGYGQFVVLYAVLLYTNTLQLALIIGPMMSIAPQFTSHSDRTKYLEGTIALQLLFSFLLSLSISLVGIGLENRYSEWQIKDNILPLAATILFFQLQDWLRRYYFLCRRGKAVFINDVISYGGQVALLFLFYSFGKLTIANAFWSIAISAAIAFFVGMVTEKIRLVWANALWVFKQSWQFGRDMLLSGQFSWAGSQGILLVGASTLNVEAIGGIRAAQNIVGVLNILFQAIENVVPVSAARHYTQTQLNGLIDYLRKFSLLSGMLIAVPCTMLVLLSEPLMQLTYGKAFVGFSELIAWQVVYSFIGFFYTIALYFHRTVGSTKVNVIVTMVSSMLTLLFTVIFIHSLKEKGIMLALVLGHIFGLIFALFTAHKYYKKVTSN